VASLSQGRTAAAQCGLFTHKSVPVIFEPPCKYAYRCSEKCAISQVFANVYKVVGVEVHIRGWFGK